MKILGFDPGKKGGYCILGDNGEILSKGVMPLIGNEYDALELRDIIEDCDRVYIENPSIIVGVSKSAVASLFKCVGLLQGICIGESKHYVLVAPKEWQKVMWQNIPKQYKNSTTKEGPGTRKISDTKATSTIAAQRFFPMEDFKLTVKGN